MYASISLNKHTLAEMMEWRDASSTDYLPRSARKQFETVLRDLHKAIQDHMPDQYGCKPQTTAPGWVQQIYVSVFGFSRGATSARAFANWLVALCKLDAQLLGKTGTTLGGFPVNFDFLGLFDTVASVGVANTFNTGNGHWGWADAEVSLRVPGKFTQCLHLVSAHEVRRSFPLDSISLNGALESGREEIVYPGVHSDVGGGYCPNEQGKGKDEMGTDMLSRLPLAHMYRAARLAGVPLKLELVKQQSVKDDFKIATATIAAFNQYLSHAKCTDGSLTDIMREQRTLYILWRYLRRQDGPAPLEGNAEKGIKAIDSFLAARNVDQNDLRGANEEFTKEIADYERWRTTYLASAHTGSAASGGRDVPRRPEDIPLQAPGFNNQWYDEWKEITRFWNQKSLPEGMAAFFDDYVHDSRAWFKLAGTEADDVERELQSWLHLIKEHEERLDDKPVPLTPNQQVWALEYRRTGKVPNMKTDGREPSWAGAGYLRYRKVYAGADSLLISHGDHLSSPTRFATTGPTNTAKAA